MLLELCYIIFLMYKHRVVCKIWAPWLNFPTVNSYALCFINFDILLSCLAAVCVHIVVYKKRQCWFSTKAPLTVTPRPLILGFEVRFMSIPGLFSKVRSLKRGHHHVPHLISFKIDTF